MTTHALLSPSGATRWFNCPGSIEAEKGYEDKPSSFAKEGTLAHELAEHCLMNDVDTSYEDVFKISNLPYESEYPEDMKHYIQGYVDYVLSFKNKKYPMFIEEKVHFFPVKGFGTVDAYLFDGKICHIFDLKYGAGILVSVKDNLQMKLYALGVYYQLKHGYDLTSFKLHIYQPRKNNIDTFDLSIEELLKFENLAKEKVENALKPHAPRIAGDEQCRWCKAKVDCKVLYEKTCEIVNNPRDDLTYSEKKNILDHYDMIISFLKSVKDSVFESIKKGEKFEGYKIVEGRSNRQYTEEAEPFLVNLLGEGAYNKKLITITEAEKLLGKPKLKNVLHKPAGNLILVPNNDKRC